MLVTLLVACTGGDTKVDPIAGTVTAESGESGDVTAAVAFGVVTNGKAGILVSPNPDTTCAHAGSYFSGGDADFSNEVVTGEGVCNVYIRLDDYDGSEVSLTDDTSATLSLNCAMDTGTWDYERHGGSPGYYYSGPWWYGSPESYTLTVSGGDDGSDLSATVSMDTYSGYFPYDEDNPEADPASGDVSGAFTATWCDDIAPALN
jgi:hypothetical protein